METEAYINRAFDILYRAYQSMDYGPVAQLEELEESLAEGKTLIEMREDTDAILNTVKSEIHDLRKLGK